MKEAAFDDDVKANSLERVWIAKANAIQRKGRAGRTRPGKLYRLYSKARYMEIMSDFSVPAMQREALDSLILRLCGMNLTADPRDILRRCLDTPDETRMNKSIEKLRRLNAIDTRFALTPLGFQLNRMGVDPEIGKMIMYGLCFGCYRPISIVAAALSHKSPFVKLNDAAKIKAQHHTRLELGVNSQSDMVAIMMAYEKWASEGMMSFQWADQHFLSQIVMSMINRIVEDFNARLAKTNFALDQRGCESWDRNSNYVNVITQVLSGVLLPKVVTSKRKHVETSQKVKISDESVIAFNNIDCSLGTFYEMLKLQSNRNLWNAWELNPCTDLTLLLFQKPMKIGQNILSWFGEGRFELTYRNFFNTEKTI